MTVYKRRTWDEKDKDRVKQEGDRDEEDDWKTYVEHGSGSLGVWSSISALQVLLGLPFQSISIMKLAALLLAATYVSTATAAITWSLQKAANPTADQLDAYTKIEAAMKKAIARYSKFSTATKVIRVYYSPGVPTAEANYNGDLRFGSDRSYMTERTALHETAHTLGVGQTVAFDRLCKSGDWKTALPLLRSFDGSSAKISCGGGHFWPYGLNYETEWSETNGDRHVKMVQAMLNDGM